jgi:hypothetical protein
MVGCVDSSADGIAYGWRLLCATANHGLRVLLGDIRVRMVRRLVLMEAYRVGYGGAVTNQDWLAPLIAKATAEGRDTISITEMPPRRYHVRPRRSYGGSP